MEKTLIINLVCSIVGIIMGYVSFNLTKITGIPAINILLLLVVIFFTKHVLQGFINEKKPWSWWFSNGLGVLILLWLVVWTVFLNL